jgi:hypothetical protein
LRDGTISAIGWLPLLWRALFPSSFRFQVNQMAQKLPSAFFLTTSGIQHCVPRRTNYRIQLVRSTVHTRRNTEWTTRAAGSAVFGEVFWADVSASDKGFWDFGGWWQIVMQVFTLLFQLRYIAHQAATFPRLKSMYYLRWSAYFISWLLCGPLAAQLFSQLLETSPRP